MSDNDISTPKFSVGDHVCTDQSELSGWAPATIDEVYSDGSYRAITDSGVPFKLALDWEQYYYTCAIEEPPVDKCTGVSCPNICYNGSLYMQNCVDGDCKRGALLKSPANAPECNSSDVSIVSWTIPSSANKGDTVNTKVNVKNNGFAPITVVTSVSGTKSDGTPIISKATSTIDAGATIEVSCPIIFDNIGNYSITPVIYLSSDYPVGDPIAIGNTKTITIVSPGDDGVDNGDGDDNVDHGDVDNGDQSGNDEGDQSGNDEGDQSGGNDNGEEGVPPSEKDKNMAYLIIAIVGALLALLFGG